MQRQPSANSCTAAFFGPRREDGPLIGVRFCGHGGGAGRRGRGACAGVSALAKFLKNREPHWETRSKGGAKVAKRGIAKTIAFVSSKSDTRYWLGTTMVSPAQQILDQKLRKFQEFQGVPKNLGIRSSMISGSSILGFQQKFNDSGQFQKFQGKRHPHTHIHHFFIHIPNSWNIGYFMV